MDDFDNLKDLWESNDGRFVVLVCEDGMRLPCDLNQDEYEFILIEKDDECEEVVRRMLAAGAALVHENELEAAMDAWARRPAT